MSDIVQSWRPGQHVKVHRITDRNDPDLHPALRLYVERLPPEERDDPEDIKRWLDELLAERREGVAKLEDYFLVLKIRDQVAAIAYFQYYYSTRYAFIGYLVGTKGVEEAVGGQLAVAALTWIQNSHPECKGVLFELEKVGLAESEDDKELRRARIALLQGRHLKIPYVYRLEGVNYLQAQLRPDTGEPEIPMHLMYVPLPLTADLEWLPRSDVEQMVRFVLEQVQGDAFETDEHARERYRNYLRSVADRIVNSLPEIVNVGRLDYREELTI